MVFVGGIWVLSGGSFVVLPPFGFGGEHHPFFHFFQFNLL